MSAGPFRFNFSRGGVGVSVGVKGLRVGSGPRGHYIHAGVGGLYYRASIGNAGRRPARTAPLKNSDRVALEHCDVTMIEIESGDVLQMRDETFKELLDEINAKSGQTRASVALCWLILIFGMVAGFASGGAGLMICILALPGWALGKWYDDYRRSSVLYYDLEDDAEVAYRQLTDGFDILSKCSGKWHIAAGGAIESLTAWKRNAGASHLVERVATSLTYELPFVIKSNISPPALRVGKQMLFFMPDVVLVQDGNRFGVVGYSELRVSWQDSHFIEAKSVPHDAIVVSYTWQHPNKNGGPDRRFRYNRQIPVCLYEAVHFCSNSGINEMLQFSRAGVAGSFAEGCRMLGRLPRNRIVLPLSIGSDVASASLLAHETNESSAAVVPVKNKRYLRTLMLVAVITILGLPIIGTMLGPPHLTPSKVSSSNIGLVMPEDNLTSTLAASPESDRVSSQPSERQNINSLSPTNSVESGNDNENTDDLNARNAEAAKIVRSTSKNADVDGKSVATETEMIVEPSARYTNSYANLRGGPGKKFPILAVIPKNVKIVVSEIRGAWSFVSVDATLEGWMANSTLSPRQSE